MGKKGLSSLLFKLRDNPRPSSSSSSSSSFFIIVVFFFIFLQLQILLLLPSSSFFMAMAFFMQGPETNSFRAHASAASSFYKNANSVYDNSAYSVASPTSDDTESLLPGSTYLHAPVPVRVRSDRLLFEPGATTRSIVHARRNIHNNNINKNNIDNIMKKREEKKEVEEEDGKVNADTAGAPFEESLALTVESMDPYRDFRASMEEMVVAHAVSDWDGFEELLAWYLQANGKNTHGFIVGAFVDLLASFASASASATASASGSDSDSDSPSSTLSSTIPFDHDIEKENVVACRE